MYLQSLSNELPQQETAFNSEPLMEQTGEIMAVPVTIPSTLPSPFWGWVLIGLLVAAATGLIQKFKKTNKRRF